MLYVMPAERLRPFVAHYTLALFGNPPKTDTLELIPDAGGCLIYTKYDDGSDEVKIWGPTTKKVTVPNNNHTFPVRVFIEFHPTGLYKLGAFNIIALKNTVADLSMLDAVLCRDLLDCFRLSADTDKMIAALDERLWQAFEKHRIDDICFMLIDKVMNGAQKVSQIAQELFISERQLNRICNKYIGLSVKNFCEVVRINGVIEYIKENGTVNCAQQFEFFDHAHYNKLFKSVCGISPSSYLKSKPHYYNEPYKYG